MQIVLFRHAERENTGLENPPLSGRGERQALALRAAVEQSRWPRPHRLLVSPKLRAQMTFRPLADWMRVDSQLTPELDERQTSENGSQFTARVRRFLAWLEKQNGLLFVCSHIDWIEEALIAIPSGDDLLSEKYQAWAPGQYIHFEIQDGLWMVQKSGRIE